MSGFVFQSRHFGFVVAVGLEALPIRGMPSRFVAAPRGSSLEASMRLVSLRSSAYAFVQCVL